MLRGNSGRLLVLTAVTADKVTDAAIKVTGRERSLSLDSPQHDQVDTAAVPALVSQVTAKQKALMG